MAPPRKNPARRQRRNKKPDLRLTRSSARESVPTPPCGLLVATCKKWDEYWRSEVSNVVQTAHMPALERLFVPLITSHYVRIGDLTRAPTRTEKSRPWVRSVAHPPPKTFGRGYPPGFPPSSRALLLASFVDGADTDSRRHRGLPGWGGYLRSGESVSTLRYDLELPQKDRAGIGEAVV